MRALAGWFATLCLLLWIPACDDGGPGPADAADGQPQDADDGEPPADDGGQVEDGADTPADQVGDDAGEDGDGGQVEDGADTPADEDGDAAVEDGEDGLPEDGDDGQVEDGADGAGEEGDGADEIDPLEGCIEGDFLPFFGDLHAHSTQSDGDDSPENAFLWARDEAGLDIFALTDHMEQFVWPLTEWRDCKELADSYNAPGTFVALCGFEFATSWFGLSGHNNVFFSENLFNLMTDIPGFYDQLAACTTCIGQFNHPGDSAGHTWSDFEFHAGADRNLGLFEFNSDADAWSMLFQALDVGWHLGPQYNSDRHGTYAGANYQRTSGFFMREATREELHDAMLHRRTFMSHDRNASIALKAQGTCWMGSRLRGTASLSLSVVAEDADAGEGFASIELWGSGQQFLSSFDCAGANPCSLTYDHLVIGQTYVLARATQVDGDLLVSAPIWAQP